MANYKWNGQPCKVDFFWATIIEPEKPRPIKGKDIQQNKDDHFPWFYAYIGLRTQFAKVESRDSQPFYIWNGLGLAHEKLSNGGGMGYSHFGIPESWLVEKEAATTEEIYEGPVSILQKQEIREHIDDYWRRHRPETYAQVIERRKKLAQASNAVGHELDDFVKRIMGGGSSETTTQQTTVFAIKTDAMEYMGLNLSPAVTYWPVPLKVTEPHLYPVGLLVFPNMQWLNHFMNLNPIMNSRQIIEINLPI